MYLTGSQQLNQPLQQNNQQNNSVANLAAVLGPLLQQSGGLQNLQGLLSGQNQGKPIVTPQANLNPAAQVNQMDPVIYLLSSEYASLDMILLGSPVKGILAFGLRQGSGLFGCELLLQCRAESILQCPASLPSTKIQASLFGHFCRFM